MENAWQPDGFVEYRTRFPQTPPFAHPQEDITCRFEAVWHALGASPVSGLQKLLSERSEPWTVVLIRGFLGNYMPGNFVQARNALRRAGMDVWIARNAAGKTVAENAESIAAQVRSHLGSHPDARLILAGHSKGGLEALHTLMVAPELRASTHAVLLSQTPRGPSPVLESLLLAAHQESLRGRRRWAEWTQRVSLNALGARKGGLDLTQSILSDVVARLDEDPPGCEVIQTASWSSRPTTWLDSFHERLGEIRPGCAHDGQFYLEDLIWPGIPHVMLPHLDHAQPVMGGFGFDSARYWIAMLALALDPETHIDLETHIAVAP